jgi:hypothetical protein
MLILEDNSMYLWTLVSFVVIAGLMALTILWREAVEKIILEEGWILMYMWLFPSQNSSGKVEFSRQRRSFPGGLFPTRLVLYPYTHRFKDEFNRASRYRYFPQEVRGVWRMTTRTIRRRFLGTRRIGDQRPLRRIHDCQASVECSAPTAAKRIIATGIKNEQFHFHPCVIHTPENPIRRDGMVFHIGRLRKHPPDRKQIVQAINLRPMAREEEEPDTSPWNPPCEVPNGSFHGGLIGITHEGHLKTQPLYHGCHSVSVVEGITQRTLGIGGVAND